MSEWLKIWIFWTVLTQGLAALVSLFLKVML